MSIVLDRTSLGNELIQGSGFMRQGICVSSVGREDDSCSSSSSIGNNSDVSSSEGGNSGESEEVQSCFKGTFDSLNSLEQVLPMRRGISKFYNGKSKSFASLGDASAVSAIKEVAKPDDAYSRRRRNILASSYHVWDKNKNFPLRSSGGGISKRSSNLSRSTLALAVAMSSGSESNGNSEDSSSGSTSPLPPLSGKCYTNNNNNAASSPRGPNLSPWRSFSVADLQHCASAGSTCSYLGETKNLT